MRTTSADYKSAIYATERECRGYIKFNNDATKLIRGCDGLVSITLHEQLADEERPMFGGACSRYVEVEFFNSGLPAGVSLANSYIDTYMGVVTKDTGTAPVDSIENDTATVEYIWNGRFYISEIDRAKLSTKVVAYDEFAKLNKDYVPTVTASGSGYSVDDIAEDILTQAGFVSTSVSLTGYVDELYEGTCRQMLSWVWGTNSLGCNLKMSRTAPTSITAITLDGAWSDKDNAENAVTDNEIYLGGLGDGDPFTVSSVTTGTENNPITAGSGTGLVGENPYLTSANASTILTNVGGITFKPMTIEFRGNPAIDTGDVLKVTSDGNTAYCYVQKMTTTFNGGIKQTIECYGDSEFYYTTEFNPTATHIKAAVSSMAQEIQHDIETADNGVITKILDADGSWKELVIANNQDLDSATSVWRWNINGLAHSTSYSGGTYNFAVDMNGRIIANVIQTGILQDANGDNSWNLDTGALTITNGSINITTSNKDVDSISLNYSTYSDDISPYSVKLTDTDPSINQRTVVNATGIKGYRGGNWTTPANTSMLLSASGGLELGGNGSNGTFNLKNSTGDTVAFWSGSTERLKLTDVDGNGGSLSLGGESLYFTNSSNSSLLNISPSNGMTIFDAGSIYRAEYSKEYVRFKNASSKITAQLNTFNNNSYLMLGDGSTTYNRTLLDNTGLTFRDSSDVVTATYPSYGLYAQDIASANIADQGAFVQGSVSGSGADTTSTIRLRSPLIAVTPSTTYSVGCSSATLVFEADYYNSSGTWQSNYAINATSGEFTTPSNTYYVKILIRKSDNSTIVTSDLSQFYLRKKTDLTGYVPYAMTNRELTEYVGAATSKQSLQWSTATSWTYTGLNYDLEAGYWYMVEALQTYNNAVPSGVAIVQDFSTSNKFIFSKTENDNFTSGRAWATSALISCESAFTIQLWAKAASSGVNNTVILRVRKMAAL